MALSFGKPKTGDLLQAKIDPFEGTKACLTFSAAYAVLDEANGTISLKMALNHAVSDGKITYWEADAAKDPQLDKPVNCFTLIHGKEWTRPGYDPVAKKYDASLDVKVKPSDYELYCYNRLLELATSNTPFSGSLLTGVDAEKEASKASDPDYSESAKEVAAKKLLAAFTINTEKVNEEHAKALESLKLPTANAFGKGGNYKAKSKEEELTEVTNWLHKTLVEDTNGQKAKLIDIGLALYDDGTEDGNNSNVIITPAVAIRTALELIFGMHKIV